MGRKTVLLLTAVLLTSVFLYVFPGTETSPEYEREFEPLSVENFEYLEYNASARGVKGNFEWRYSSHRDGDIVYEKMVLDNITYTQERNLTKLEEIDYRIYDTYKLANDSREKYETDVRLIDLNSYVSEISMAGNKTLSLEEKPDYVETTERTLIEASLNNISGFEHPPGLHVEEDRLLLDNRTGLVVRFDWDVVYRDQSRSYTFEVENLSYKRWEKD